VCVCVYVCVEEFGFQSSLSKLSLSSCQMPGVACWRRWPHNLSGRLAAGK